MQQLATAAAVAATGKITLPFRQMLEEFDRQVIDADKLEMMLDNLDEVLSLVFDKSNLFVASDSSPKYEELSAENALERVLTTVRKGSYSWIGLYVPAMQLTGDGESSRNWAVRGNLKLDSPTFFAIVRSPTQSEDARTGSSHWFNVDAPATKAPQFLLAYTIQNKTFDASKPFACYSFVYVDELFKDYFSFVESGKTNEKAAVPAACKPPSFAFEPRMRAAVFAAPYPEQMYPPPIAPYPGYPPPMGYGAPTYPMMGGYGGYTIVDTTPMICTPQGCCMCMADYFAMACAFEAADCLCTRLCGCGRS